MEPGTRLIYFQKFVPALFGRPRSSSLRFAPKRRLEARAQAASLPKTHPLARAIDFPSWTASTHRTAVIFKVIQPCRGNHIQIFWTQVGPGQPAFFYARQLISF